MLLNRKDIDDLERKIDAVAETQLKIEDALAPIQGNLERVFSEDTNLIQEAHQQSFRDHKEWLFNTFRDGYKAIVEEANKEKNEILKAFEVSVQENQRNLNNLQKKTEELLEALSKQNEALGEELLEHREEWQSARDYEIREETPSALNDWCDLIVEELQRFEGCSGMVHLLAARLFQHFKALRSLLDSLGTDANVNYENRIDELQRLVFETPRGFSWLDLTSENSNPKQRNMLRHLENAVLQFQFHVREKFQQKTGIVRLEIVPNETRFDARYHESSNFLEVPTEDSTRHNLIVSVVRAGFEKRSRSGTNVLLQVARVRRLVFTETGANKLVATQVMPLDDCDPVDTICDSGESESISVINSGANPESFDAALNGQTAEESKELASNALGSNGSGLEDVQSLDGQGVSLDSPATDESEVDKTSENSELEDQLALSAAMSVSDFASDAEILESEFAVDDTPSGDNISHLDEKPIHEVDVSSLGDTQSDTGTPRIRGQL